jgi:hypothetical protein
VKLTHVPYKGAAPHIDTGWRELQAHMDDQQTSGDVQRGAEAEGAA